jgi:hypothetical protein
MKRNTINTLLSIFALLTIVSQISASWITRSAQGANNAAISSEVNLFFSDLGGVNNGIGGSFTTGRRDLNWDSVPDNLASPNAFPGDFFKTNVPKGAFLSAGCNRGQTLRVSADSSNPTSTPVRFGEIDPSYPGIFTTFNSQRLLAVRGNFLDAQCVETIVTFSIPGTNIPATVKGFGIVYSDTDTTSGAQFQAFDVNGRLLTDAFLPAPANNGGLSFFGISFTAGERIASVKIHTGNFALFPGQADVPNGSNVVAIAAIFYGEPRASQFHSGDADGDGVADARVFRPSSGTWFTINSGSSTVSIDGFGVAGDIPIDGDFDGDSRADLAIYRPSDGGWYIALSGSSGSFITQAFGGGADMPVAGDYDKDGKTDIAIWRPSTGEYYVLRSSDNQTSFYAFPFGQNGDIPVQGAAH